MNQSPSTTPKNWQIQLSRWTSLGCLFLAIVLWIGSGFTRWTAIFLIMGIVGLCVASYSKGLIIREPGTFAPGQPNLEYQQVRAQNIRETEIANRRYEEYASRATRYLALIQLHLGKDNYDLGPETAEFESYIERIMQEPEPSWYFDEMDAEHRDLLESATASVKEASTRWDAWWATRNASGR